MIAIVSLSRRPRNAPVGELRVLFNHLLAHGRGFVGKIALGGERGVECRPGVMIPNPRDGYEAGLWIGVEC